MKSRTFDALTPTPSTITNDPWHGWVICNVPTKEGKYESVATEKRSMTRPRPHPCVQFFNFTFITTFSFTILRLKGDFYPNQCPSPSFDFLSPHLTSLFLCVIAFLCFQIHRIISSKKHCARYQQKRVSPLLLTSYHHNSSYLWPFLPHPLMLIISPSPPFFPS